jgi:hypothetical protein
MITLTLKYVDEFKMDAVFITSNSTVTSLMVHGLEVRGIHAYGPVFDS